MTNETYVYSFPIGDYSSDGHGQCEYYRVSSNKPLQDLREVHFRCPDVLGFDIGDICSRYEEREIDSSIVEKIQKHLDIENYYYDPDTKELCSDGMIELWVDLLMVIDPELKLDILPDEESIVIWGYDDKGRHLNTPGYGLFWG